MIEILNKYLVQHRSVNIPGLGTIFIETVPARSDIANKQMLPPYFVYRFDKFFDTPDRSFFSYLAASRNIPDFEAIRLYNQFASDIRSAIKSENRAVWPDVGAFIQNEAGDIEFQPLGSHENFYHIVPAERILRNNTEHAILVGDQEKTKTQMTELLQVEKPTLITAKRTWLVISIVLLTIALVYLAIHFYRYGFTLSATTNQTSISF